MAHTKGLIMPEWDNAELARLQGEAVRALYRLVKAAPDDERRAVAQAHADDWQRRMNVDWAASVAAKRASRRAEA